jgi:hypothetical protein
MKENLFQMVPFSGFSVMEGQNIPIEAIFERKEKEYRKN